MVAAQLLDRVPCVVAKIIGEDKARQKEVTFRPFDVGSERFERDSGRLFSPPADATKGPSATAGGRGDTATGHLPDIDARRRSPRFAA